MTEHIRLMREHSIFMPQGRIFLIATAHSYGYDVDEKYNIVDSDGNILPVDHEDYHSIVRMARSQASAESHIGSDMLE